MCLLTTFMVACGCPPGSGVSNGPSQGIPKPQVLLPFGPNGVDLQTPFICFLANFCVVVENCHCFQVCGYVYVCLAFVQGASVASAPASPVFLNGTTSRLATKMPPHFCQQTLQSRSLQCFQQLQGWNAFGYTKSE